jgi:ribose transport system permease protein
MTAGAAGTSGSAGAPGTAGDAAVVAAGGPPWARVLREQTLLPLLVLLAALVALMQVVQPGIVSAEWAASIVRFATPLAILAACQTLVMLTGGIDLSVATVASMTAYLAATQYRANGEPTALAIGLVAALVVGLVNGVGIALFRVQPLIMTLATGLVTAGFLTVYQTATVATATSAPPFVSWIGGGVSFDFVPNSLLLLVPVALLVVFVLHRMGFGRLLYAVGDNPVAARLAGVRVWQVLLAVYVVSAFLAGIAGLILSALAGSTTQGIAEPYLLPSVAAVVIGGTSIFGGRGGYTGSIVGAVILTILVSLLTVLDAPFAVRQIIYGLIILAVAAAYTRVTGQQ